jgi:hypothetical protein
VEFNSDKDAELAFKDSRNRYIKRRKLLSLIRLLRNREFGGTEICWAENVPVQTFTTGRTSHLIIAKKHKKGRLAIFVDRHLIPPTAAKEPNLPRSVSHRNERTICVTNLEDVQESVLQDVFGSCGEVTAIEQVMHNNADNFTG